MKTVKTLGFANSMYTLWEVSTPESVDYLNESIKGVLYTFIKNVSNNYEKAISIMNSSYSFYDIDLDLRGEDGWRKIEPLNLDKDLIEFTFGKYKGLEISVCEDSSYVLWYYEQTLNNNAKKYLDTANNIVFYNNEYITSKCYNDILERAEKDKLKNSLINGHHFEDGKRVELELKVVDEFSFDGMYGTTYIVSYQSNDGYLFKYMGSKPASLNVYGFTKIKATISHSEYKGIDETKLKRINLIYPKLKKNDMCDPVKVVASLKDDVLFTKMENMYKDKIQDEPMKTALSNELKKRIGDNWEDYCVFD